MQDIFILAISSLLIISTEMYLILNILKIKHDDFINRKVIFLFIPYIIAPLSYVFLSNTIRMITIAIALILSAKIVYKKNLNRTISAVVSSQFIMVISEIIFLVIMSFMTGFDANELVNTTYGTFFTHFAISLITLILFKIKIIKSYIIKTIDFVDNLNTKYLSIITVVFICIVNFLIVSSLYKVNVLFLLTINSIVILFVSFIVYRLMKQEYKVLQEQNKIVKYKAENDALINNLNAYERMADQHRVINHENKNQLSTIKQMIQNDDNKVVGYIDNLIGTSMPDNERLIEKTKRIPSGGLQGIIYQKMLTMNKLKIKYNLTISRDLKELDFRKLDIDTTVELCKILGVYIDNAIQEVLKLKEKLIDIEIFVEESKLCVSIANNYGKKVDFSKIGEPGYTTKGKNHGYGLTLVNEILEHNKRFENEKRVTPKYFKQIIKVKRMKTNY